VLLETFQRLGVTEFNTAPTDAPPAPKSL